MQTAAVLTSEEFDPVESKRQAVRCVRRAAASVGLAIQTPDLRMRCRRIGEATQEAGSAVLFLSGCTVATTSGFDLHSAVIAGNVARLNMVLPLLQADATDRCLDIAKGVIDGVAGSLQGMDYVNP